MNNNQKIILKGDSYYYYLAFSYFQKIGPISLQRLEKFFPDIKSAFFASEKELETAGWRRSLANAFIKWRKTSAASIENMISELGKEKISFLTWHDDDYPGLLREISSAPFILYYKGSLNNVLKNRLAIVGSRRHSAYAEKIIQELTPPLINAGLEIVSGLAIGVDTLAHKAALNNKGVTLAVLGSGLDNNRLYPRTNRYLAEKIIDSGGALISEFSPNTPPYKQNFPQRNRIISGLTQATLVIEAKLKSGALITANYALEQNREVLAVPGSIFSTHSSGTNKLISSGAKSISSSEDILEIFKLNHKNEKSKLTVMSKSYQPENKVEKIIYDLIKRASECSEKISADEIIKESQLDTALINSTLSMLEIKGVAKNDGFGYDLN